MWLLDHDKLASQHLGALARELMERDPELERERMSCAIEQELVCPNSPTLQQTRGKEQAVPSEKSHTGFLLPKDKD